MIIVVQNPEDSLVENAIMLWHGTSAALPAGWSVFSSANGYYIYGGSTASTTPVGANTHTHTNSVTGGAGSHTHTGGWNTTGASTVDSNSYGVTTYTEIALGGHTHAAGTFSAGNVSTASNHTHTLSNTNSGNHQPVTKKLYYIKWTSGALPNGVIVMWSGASGTIPAGWSICNGTGGTVDLRGYFVQGASSDGEVGSTTSGSHTHTNPNAVSGGAHTHSISTTSDMTYVRQKNGLPGGAILSQSLQAHYHAGTGTAASDGAHQHTTPTTDPTSVIPPAYLLYYIQKTA